MRTSCVVIGRVHHGRKPFAFSTFRLAPQLYEAETLGLAVWSRGGACWLGCADTIRSRALELVASTYTSVIVPTLCEQLGMARDAVLALVASRNWQYDKSKDVVTPTPPPRTKLQTTSQQQLAQLTDYIVHLEDK